MELIGREMRSRDNDSHALSTKSMYGQGLDKKSQGKELAAEKGSSASLSAFLVTTTALFLSILTASLMALDAATPLEKTDTSL